MVPRLITDAIEFLRTLDPLAPASRAAIEAYARLAAFAHHYPSRCPPEAKALLGKHARVREREPSRFLKQRRLAIAQISFDLSKAA